MLLWSTRLMGTISSVLSSPVAIMIECCIIRPAAGKNGRPKAYTCSAVTKDGLDELWDVIQEFTEQGKKMGVFLKRRQEQSPPLGT